MRTTMWLVVSLLCAAPLCAGQVGFVSAPTAERVGGGVKIRFAPTAPTDFEVAVLNSDGEVIRHLAARAVGRKDLRQEIVWDGKDDAGKAVDVAECSVRVRLGLSHALDRVLGWNPRTVGEIKALAVAANGDLYCLNGYSVPSLAVFDRSGKYLRTLLPHDPNQPAEKLTGIEHLTRGDGVRIPRLRNMREPYGVFAELGLGRLQSYGSMVLTADFVLVAGPRSARLGRFGRDGGLPDPLLTSSVPAAGKGGVSGLAMGPTGRVLLAAARGAIHRAPLSDEAALKFSAFASGLKSTGGLAVDAAGRVLVCDTAAGRVAIFAADGTPAGSIETPEPLDVAVHPKTGAIYVLARDGVRKYSGVDAARRVWTLPLAKVPGNTPPVFALDRTAERPILYVGCPQQMGYSKYVLWRVEDLGKTCGEPVEMSDRARTGLYSPVHIAVDPARDEVYVREWRESWRGQRFKRFDGATGQRTDLPIRGNSMAVGPDGMLYCRGFHGMSVGSYITRYDRQGNVVPLPGAKDNPPPARKRPGLWMLGSYRGATGVGMKGFTIAPSGDLYVLRYFSARGGKGPWAKAGYAFPEHPPGVDFLTPLMDVYDADGRLKQGGIIRYFKQGACGVKVDRAGNIYVADHIKPRDRYYPADLAGQLPKVNPARPWRWPLGSHNWYRFNCGTLFKFPPTGGRIEPTAAGDASDAWFAGSRGNTPRFVKVRGALWQHVGMSPVPADTNRGHGGGCVCTNGRFDLDAFGRVYVPDVLRFAVDVLDENGTRITSFGRYGNADSRGPAIGINWGSFVGCSRKAVYICDNLNRRIVRVVRRYTAETLCIIK